MIWLPVGSQGGSAVVGSLIKGRWLDIATMRNGRQLMGKRKVDWAKVRGQWRLESAVLWHQSEKVHVLLWDYSIVIVEMHRGRRGVGAFRAGPLSDSWSRMTVEQDGNIKEECIFNNSSCSERRCIYSILSLTSRNLVSFRCPKITQMMKLTTGINLLL